LIATNPLSVPSRWGAHCCTDDWSRQTRCLFLADELHIVALMIDRDKSAVCS